MAINLGGFEFVLFCFVFEEYDCCIVIEYAKENYHDFKQSDFP